MKDLLNNKPILIAIGVIMIAIILGFFFKNNLSSTNKESTKEIIVNKNDVLNILDKNNPDDNKFAQSVLYVEDKPLINKDASNIGYLYNFYSMKISDNEFVMDAELDKTIAEVIFRHENPWILSSYMINTINNCKDYPNVTNALIAETMRKPLKPYIVSLSKNEILKLNDLVQKCK